MYLRPKAKRKNQFLDVSLWQRTKRRLPSSMYLRPQAKEEKPVFRFSRTTSPFICARGRGNPVADPGFYIGRGEK